MKNCLAFYSVVILLSLAGCSGLKNELNFDRLSMTNVENKTEIKKDRQPKQKVVSNCVNKENSLFGFSKTCESGKLFFESILSDDAQAETVDNNMEVETVTKPKSKCKLKEGTLFGFSRTCDNSGIMAKSLTD